jgi:hypothetical protein
LGRSPGNARIESSIRRNLRSAAEALKPAAALCVLRDQHDLEHRGPRPHRVTSTGPGPGELPDAEGEDIAGRRAIKRSGETTPPLAWFESLDDLVWTIVGPRSTPGGRYCPTGPKVTDRRTGSLAQRT